MGHRCSPSISILFETSLSSKNRQEKGWWQIAIQDRVGWTFSKNSAFMASAGHAAKKMFERKEVTRRLL